MAKVIWQKRAERELYRYLVKGFQEFGETTANKFAARAGFISKNLEKFPETGFPEPLRKDRKKLYRACQINHRFKVIYYYAASSDIVHIADIWDTRREPSKLAKRIKQTTC